MKWFRRALAGLAIVLIVLLLTLAAVWFGFQHRTPPGKARRPLFTGITYERDVWTVPRPVVIHLVTIDLQTPGLRFGVTPGDSNRALPLTARTTSAYLKEAGAQVAINADFFYPWVSHTPWDFYPHVGDPVTVQGRSCADGDCYAGGPERDRFPSLFLSKGNRATIATIATTATTATTGARVPGDLYNVVSGNEIILRDGRVIAKGKEVQPRTAVGLDAARRRLLLIVVDGRQPNYSEGVTIPELAELLRAHGADVALNLDGGGSATLASAGTNGEPQVLNSPIDNRIPGRERPVANHLVVFAPPR